MAPETVCSLLLAVMKQQELFPPLNVSSVIEFFGSGYAVKPCMSTCQCVLTSVPSVGLAHVSVC